MEKQLLEMMGKMMEQMTGIQSEMKDMKIEITDMKTEMTDMKSEMNVRFDSVDSKLGLLDVQLNSGFKQTGKRFDKLDKTTEQLVTRDVRFLKHKMHQLEEDVFLLNKNN